MDHLIRGFITMVFVLQSRSFKALRDQAEIGVSFMDLISARIISLEKYSKYKTDGYTQYTRA